MSKKYITKQLITSRTIAYQLAGYGILLILIVADEVLDLPHAILGASPTPINWPEMIVEGMCVALLCAFTVFLSLRFLNRMKFLEGLVQICSQCKRIRDGNEWRPLESYVSDHSEALFAQGQCPDCIEKELFRELRNQ